MYNSLKKVLCVLMVLVLVVGVLLATAEPYDIDITSDFTCPNFLTAVRQITGIPAPEPIFLLM
ncbi:MAG: hypothetical protein FWE27_04385 [Defluviitaleaceae bacterium]|nr:hypothetical protein [Defluviitaleaceae bacterium]